MKRQGRNGGVGHSDSTQIDKLRHRMFLCQYFEDYSHNFLDYTLVFEGRKDSVTLTALWCDYTVSRMSQSPAPPFSCLGIRRGHSLCCGFICCYWRLNLRSPSEARVWCELAACYKLLSHCVLIYIPCCMRADMWPSTPGSL